MREGKKGIRYKIRGVDDSHSNNHKLLACGRRWFISGTTSVLFTDVVQIITTTPFSGLAVMTYRIL